MYDWHKRGLATLGDMGVDLSDLFEVPINRDTFGFMKVTTSTALYVHSAPPQHLFF